MNGANHHIYEFGPFRLDARKRLLWRDGEIVTLTPKAFETLLALVEANGQVLEKNELMNRIWPDTAVEEGNLTFNISSLRKKLGDDPRRHEYIVTIPGEGYQFVAGVRAGFDELAVRERTRLTIEEEEEEGELDNPYSDQGLQIVNSPEAAIAKTPTVLATPALPGQSAIRAVLAVAGLACLLLGLGAFGLWRYKPRLSSGASAVPFQHITIKGLTNLGNVANGALSPDGKLFAYSLAEKEGRASLWLGHVEGGVPIQLRPPAEIRYLDLAFARDGNSLYYLESAAFSPGTLYRIPVFGGAPEKIKDRISDDITFAPDGKRFAFVGGNDKGRSTLVIANVQDAGEFEVASRPNRLGFLSSTPSWSPDGLMIAIAAVNNEHSREHEIFVVRVSDGSVKQLTNLQWHTAYAIEWLKDSTGVVIVAKDKQAEAAAQLWHVSYPDGQIKRIVADLNSYGSVLGLSADNSSLLAIQAQGYSNIWTTPGDSLDQGKQITFGTNMLGAYGFDCAPDNRLVYTALVGESRTIWTAKSDGSGQRQLVPTGYTNTSISVNADGRYIVFQSNRSGSVEVWRANSDGSDLRQLTSGGNHFDPHVAPAGDYVVYKSAGDEIGAVWRISLDGGEPVRLTNSAASWPRISPDGKLVACIMGAEGKTKLAIVPIEGGEPIKLFDVPRLANFSYGMRWAPDGRAVTYHDWGFGIWKQSLEGGDPQRMKGLPAEKLFAHAWSRDGKLFAFVRGVQIRDLVLIQNVK